MSSSIARLPVAICETQPATAEGLRSVLEASPDLECAWAVPTLPLALQLTRQSEVSALLIDKGAGQQLILNALQEIKRARPQIGVIIWGTSINEAEALRFLQAGARGLLRKSAGLSAIEKCFRTVATGATWLEDSVFGQDGRPTAPVHGELTPRETQVLELVHQGLRNKDIAAALGIRPGTVKIHLKHIFEKTGIHGRYSLALNVLRQREFQPALSAQIA